MENQTEKTTLTAFEKRLRRNEQSKLCKARNRANLLGLSLDEYYKTLAPLAHMEKKARRAEQSKLCRQRKAARAANGQDTSLKVVSKPAAKKAAKTVAPKVDPIEAAIAAARKLRETAVTPAEKADALKAFRRATIAKATAIKNAGRKSA